MRQAVPSPPVNWRLPRPIDTLRYYYRRAMRWVRVLVEWRPGTVQPAPGRRRVLVVRMDAIGDFVLWSGAARVLRTWLGPDTHVTLIANAAWADLARDADIADEVWPIRRGALESDGTYRAQMHARVAGGGFTMAINPRYTREMMFGDSVMRWSRAAVRIGMYGESVLLPPPERRVADGWYTQLLPTAREFMHESERHVDFLRGLGVPVEGVPEPRIAIPASDSIDDWLPKEPYFVVFAGASLNEHRWPALRFAELAREVQARTGWRPVLLGDRSELALTQSIEAQLPRALNLAGATSTPMFAAIIQRARLVLTNDTSAVHVAAATGVHAICIAGGWHWERFVPYPDSLPEFARYVHPVSMVDEMPCFKCNGYCTLPHLPNEPRPCVERVSVARAVGVLDRVLSLPDFRTDG